MSTTVRGAAAPTSQDADRDDADSVELEAVVARVAARAASWAATSATERAELLRRVIDDTAAAAPAWLEDACRAKGLDPARFDGGEELFSGIITFVRMATTIHRSLEQIASTGRPQFPGPVRETADGRLVVQIFPADSYDKLLFAKTTAEVWIEPGVTRAELEADQAPAYRDPEGHQGLALVLGAGNVASLGPRDVLTKLFVEGKVVVLKANPVNDYLVPHWRRALAALIEAGVLEIVDGGAAAGKLLCALPLVDEIHVTGSDKTHDAIVFGTGEDGQQRKASGAPLLDKPVSCELGSVSPIIIVPGVWSEKDLAYQAEHVATMLVNNAGFNCTSSRVIITWSGWPQRQAFFEALEGVLAAVAPRLAYYPGAAARHQAFLEAHPDAHQLGRKVEGTLPWTLVRDVDPTRTDDICFNVEAFCSVMAETALDAPTPADFVDEAVSFSNDVLWGTLSATVLAHPNSLKDPVVGPRVEAAIEDLRFGGLGLNVWHGLVFALCTTTWGAYPGHPITDIQSGSGVVGNAYMLTHTQKSVVRGPWRSSPKPPWFATAKRTKETMDRVLDLEVAPSLAKLPALMWVAFGN